MAEFRACCPSCGFSQYWQVDYRNHGERHPFYCQRCDGVRYVVIDIPAVRQRLQDQSREEGEQGRLQLEWEAGASERRRLAQAADTAARVSLKEKEERRLREEEEQAEDEDRFGRYVIIALLGASLFLWFVFPHIEFFIRSWR